MRVTFSGKSVQITDRERDYAEKKLQRLERYFNGVRVAHLSYSVQRNWQIVEVQVDLNGTLLRAEERSPDFFASVDAVTEITRPWTPPIQTRSGAAVAAKPVP